MALQVKQSLKRRFSWGKFILFLMGVAMVLVILELTGRTHFFHKQAVSIIPAVNTNSSQTGSSKKTQSASSGSTQPPVINNQKPSTPAANATTLIAPFGTFVSNHTPGKDNTPTREQSVCNTTPGASCYIQFSKDGSTKALGSQAVDSSGATYWTWDVSDAKTVGLTAGSWQVSAIATLNGQSKTTDDVIPLEIQ